MAVQYNQSGYVGSSMSVRAKQAYQSGEKPLTKWSKSELIEVIETNVKNVDVELLYKYSVRQLRCVCLCETSWHHTGMYANQTSFYSIDDELGSKTFDEIIEHLEYIKQLEREEKEVKVKNTEELYKCLFDYIEWQGTRKYPKAIEKRAYGIIKGNWIYYLGGKKKLDGKYVEVVKKFDRAPKGTAKEFKEIMKGIK